MHFFLVPLTFLESLLVVLINYFDLLIPVKLTTYFEINVITL